MTKVAIPVQKLKVDRLNRLHLGTYSYIELHFSDHNGKYVAEIDRSDIRDFILDNIEDYKSWFDQNYALHQEDSDREKATEMAYHAFESDWIFDDYIKSLSSSSLDDLREGISS